MNSQPAGQASSHNNDYMLALVLPHINDSLLTILCLSGMDFPRRKVTSAVITTFASAPFILLLRAEAPNPPKNDTVNCSDTCAGKHRDYLFRYHGHIDTYPVSFGNPKFFQPVCHSHDSMIQLPICENTLSVIFAFQISATLFRRAFITWRSRQLYVMFILPSINQRAFDSPIPSPWNKGQTSGVPGRYCPESFRIF